MNTQIISLDCSNKTCWVDKLDRCNAFVVTSQAVTACRDYRIRLDALKIKYNLNDKDVKKLKVQIRMIMDVLEWCFYDGAKKMSKSFSMYYKKLEARYVNFSFIADQDDYYDIIPLLTKKSCYIRGVSLIITLEINSIKQITKYLNDVFRLTHPILEENVSRTMLYYKKKFQDVTLKENDTSKKYLKLIL